MRNDILFIQSQNDFPLTVNLDRKNPSWELNRWNGQGLRFVPFDDEGFNLRGDKRRLVYKGRQRSHRFTILGDSSFEYDCILEKEPESNVVSLLMEGAESFDFFKQPDFVPDPFFKGSYAVYKKETLLGEGTGKLCHIHRPLIIDARGRKIWGELSIVGNELQITIPEQWLAEAKYPVVVDPTMGTTQIGSQTIYYDEDNEGYYDLMFELSIPVNRFLVPETLNGLCTAYAYTNQDDWEAGGRPVIYSDNNNSPLTRRSTQEGLMDFRVGSGKPAGWRSATFRTNTSIASGSNIWFGVFCEYYWLPRFDWGAKCYVDWWDMYDSIPNTYPIWNTNYFKDFKLSMYFTYDSPAQNYVRTLTQGVRLNDSRKLTADYKRSSTQTARASTSLSRFETFIRQCVQNVRNTMSLARLPVFLRFVNDNIRITEEIKNNRELSRKCEDEAKASEEIKRSQGLFRNIYDNLTGTEKISFSVLFVRSISETQGITDTIQKLGAYIRGLYVEAGSMAEPIRWGDFYRVEKNTVQAEGALFRGLLIFVKLLSTSIVRDFVLRRFLIAREELVLKSCITRDLILESKIN